MIHALLLFSLVSVQPQDPGSGKLLLPPRPKPAPKVETQQLRDEDLDAFLKEAMKLRRTQNLPEAALDLALRPIGEKWPTAADLALRALRQADADLAYALVHIAQRFGERRHGEELLYLALTRPMGTGSREALLAMSALLGEGAKDALFQCLRANFVTTQQAARDLLAPAITKEDLPRLLELSRDRKADVVARALELLAGLPLPEARSRLVEALSAQDAGVAQTAFASLLAQGAAAAPELQALLERPAVDFAFGYACLLLVQLEERTGEPYLRETMVPHLKRELATPDPFFQATGALALARIAYRSTDTTGKPYADTDVVDSLLLVAAPKGFVTAFSLLERPVGRTLATFTGQEFRGAEPWRVWWKTMRDGFVGQRQHLAITPALAAATVLQWHDPRGAIRVFGEQATLPEKDLGLFCVLSGTELSELVARLQSLGFMGDTPRLSAARAAREDLPQQRLEAQLGRVRIASNLLSDRTLTALRLELEKTLLAERWQLYRDPRTEPDFSVFWRKEREWLAQNQAPRARAQRLAGRIVRALPSLEAVAQARAADHMLEIPDIKQILSEADAKTIVTSLAQRQKLDDEGFRWLEIALLPTTDTVWKDVLDLLDRTWTEGGKERLPRAFALLGADKVLLALEDQRPRIRLQAMEEACNGKDLRAVPVLLPAIATAQGELRRTAIYSLGRLRATAARPVLLESLAKFDEETRRTAWIALGRIGGEDVLPVLEHAIVSRDPQDRMAAIQALGELKQPEAARILAQVYAASSQEQEGELALVQLRKLGALLARPALRESYRSDVVAHRRDLILALAEFQDPEAVPGLVDLLAQPNADARALTFLIASTTGLALDEVDDRVNFVREWHRRKRDVPQSTWFIDALQRANVETTLQADQLHNRASPATVRELARLLIALRDKPHLRMLTVAMLRETTEQDFGTLPAGAPEEVVRGLADRYRFWAETQRAANK